MPTRYRLPRREGSWGSLGALALLIAIACAIAPFIVEIVALRMGAAVSPGWIVLALVLTWAVSLGATLALHAGMPRLAARELQLDSSRRLLDGGRLYDLNTAASVEVQPHRRYGRSRIVVRDGEGAILWALDDLRTLHAHALALDLSSGLGLYADPALGRTPEGQAASDRPQFAQGMHDVRIGLWSHPWQTTLIALSGTVPSLVMSRSEFGSQPWAGIGMVLISITLLTFVLLALPLPRWLELQIRADRLVVRQGWPFTQERSVPIAQLAPPRLATNAAEQPCLVLRAHDGFQVEIVDRPRQELEWVAGWIEHARSQMAAQLAEPEPEPPEALDALRGRARQPIPQ